MNDSFDKDTYVVYGKTGVCRVVERCVMSFGSAGGEEYYVLSPVSDPRSSVYVPCGNAKLVSRMRPLLSKDEIDRRLADVDADPLEWIEEKAERQILFRELMTDGDPGQLLRLIRCLYAKRQEKLQAGKRLSSADESLLQESIRLLEEEFAHSLSLTKSQVATYIQDHLENN